MAKVNIVAEIGCNHMGSLDKAFAMIKEAKNCGADFVKFQKRDLNTMPKEIRDKPYDSPNSFGNTVYLHRLKLEFNRAQWKMLISCASSYGIGIFGTPFDIPSYDLLLGMDLPYIKIGSAQFHDDDFMQYVVLRGKGPIIMSTGMADQQHVDRNYQAVSSAHRTIVMQTTSAYPCEEDCVNLRVLNVYAKKYPAIGLSGHYVSGNGAIEAAAVMAGATWVERHFTLDRTWKGTDQAASLEPEGLRRVVNAVRSVERALGRSYKYRHRCEQATWDKCVANA